jgi:hypothetical protein
MVNCSGPHAVRVQIETLLAYPGVGPLEVGAIAINLAVSNEILQAALQLLIEDGRIVHLPDGRYATSSRSGL